MNLGIKLGLGLLYGVLASASPATAKAQGFKCEPIGTPEWQFLAEGAEWAKFDVRFTPYHRETQTWEGEASRSVTVRAFRIDPEKIEMRFHRSTQDLECDPSKDRYIRKLIGDSRVKALGAINASFFVMPNGKTLGVTVDERRIWNTNVKEQGIASSGVLSLKNAEWKLETRDQFIERHGPVVSPEEAREYRFAVQAYPRLLVDGQVVVSDRVKEDKRPRTSIGLGVDSSQILLVTLDAGGETLETGMSLYEFAHFSGARDCGLMQKTVLNLDGGGSTAFALPAKGLYHQADRCRHLGNILMIQPRSKKK
jgi:hypothetical protein